MIELLLVSKHLTKARREGLANKLAQLVGSYKYQELMDILTIDGHIRPSKHYAYNRMKAVNEAIESGKKISFDCKRLKRKMDPEHDSETESFVMSPYAVINGNSFLYAVGYSDSHRAIVCRRIDLIIRIPDILDEPAVPLDPDIDLEQFIYCKYHNAPSTRQRISLIVDDRVLPAVEEWTGKDTEIVPIGDNTSRVTSEVPIGADFYQWIFGLDGKVQVLEPENMRLEYENRLLASAMQVLKDRQNRIT